MTDEPKVTVIIPAYNSEKTLPAMIRCVQKQSYENLEIIVINDGSSDRTKYVIGRYADDDSRIVAIDKENGGVSSARNLGLDMASGDYVCFYDSDDRVPAKAIEKLVRHAESKNADLVIGMMRISELNESRITASTEALANRKAIGKFNKNLSVSLSLGNKLFRRSIIEEHSLRFDDLSRVEDGIFVMRYIEVCGKITGCPTEVYHYLKRPFWKEASLSQINSLQAVKDLEAGYNRILGIMDDMIAGDLTDEIDEDDPKDPEAVAEQRKRLRSRFVQRAMSGTISKVYRQLWDLDEGVFNELEAFLNRYRAQISDDDWASLVEKNYDLQLGDGIGTQSDYLERPLITIVISAVKQHSDMEKILECLVESLYWQDLISFRLVIDKKYRQYLTEHQRSRNNIEFDSAPFGESALRKKVLKKCRTEYIMFIDDFVIPGKKVLTGMCRSIGDADYVSAPVVDKVNKKYMEVTSAYSLSLSCRLFRTEALRQLPHAFSRGSDEDQKKYILNTLKGVQYSESAFIAEALNID